MARKALFYFIYHLMINLNIIGIKISQKSNKGEKEKTNTMNTMKDTVKASKKVFSQAKDVAKANS